jgi:hypothetical protein
MNGETPPAPAYLQVCNWEDFVHYKGRNALWIKTYADLLRQDEYLQLSGHRRAVLHGLWLLYAIVCSCERDERATTCRCLRLNTRMLSRRLELRVRLVDLEALNRAGFIGFVAVTERRCDSS